jgi:hypothetical protein
LVPALLCLLSQIANQKLKVQKLLEAIDSIQVVKTSLSALSSAPTISQTNEDDSSLAPSSSASKLLQRSITYRSALSVRSFTSSSSESLQEEQMKRMELFACSEYERSSVGLSIATQNLSFLGEESSFSLPSTAAVVDSHFPVSPNEIQQIRDEARKYVKIFEEKMVSFIENVFVNAVSAKSSVDRKDSIPSRHVVRCFMHCVRGLSFLHCASSVEQCFVKTVVEPFIRYVIHFSSSFFVFVSSFFICRLLFLM